jgi:3-polyprenyl-4-hydroxybenzoate decarboxylase
MSELRLGDGHTGESLIAALRGKPGAWAAAARDFPVLPVEDAPLLANEVPGDRVNLLDFPVPRWHEHDGGRFIGTGCLVVTSDPETGGHNGGCYRMEFQDDGRAVIDAGRPWERLVTFPRVASSDPAYLSLVRARWGDVLA